MVGVYLNQHADSVIATNLKVTRRTWRSSYGNPSNSTSPFSGVQPFSPVQRSGGRERNPLDRWSKRQRGFRARPGQAQLGGVQERRGSDAGKRRSRTSRSCSVTNDVCLKVFPTLVDVVAEARLNLVIYYLRQNDTREAYDLLKDLQPAVPQEYILKGVVNATLGQEINSVSWGNFVLWLSNFELRFFFEVFPVTLTSTSCRDLGLTWSRSCPSEL